MVFHILLKLLLISSWLATVVMSTSECSKCLGMFCGRTSTENMTDCSLNCRACPRGYRTDGYICQKCNQTFELYDWLFLGFMALCVTVLHFYAIDAFHSSHRRVWFLHASALLESVTSFISMVLLFEPIGSFQLYKCGVKSIKDWYTVFFNPKPMYLSTIHCTQEAVYPLFTSVFIYLLFSFITMIILRGILLRIIFQNLGRSPLYAGLYIIPIVGTVHTCFSGVIYYIFPYLALFLSAVGVAIFLSMLDGNYYQKVRKPRHVGVLVCYCIAHAYGIISITEFELPIRDGTVLLLVFLPFCFYSITRPFTDADNFKI